MAVSTVHLTGSTASTLLACIGLLQWDDVDHRVTLALLPFVLPPITVYHVTHWNLSAVPELEPLLCACASSSSIALCSCCFRSVHSQTRAFAWAQSGR